MRQKGLDRRVDVGQVCRDAARDLGRADRDEVHARMLSGSDVGREPQARIVGRQQVAETRFEERSTPRRQVLDLALIDVDSDDFVAELGHAGGVNRAQVSASDD